MMNIESNIKFNNWCLELDLKLYQFQIRGAAAGTEKEYWMHRNCVRYDYEIHRLRVFNNPCKSCGIPMHLVKNFEIYEVGQVCGLCHTLHTIISASRYFSDLHDKRKAEQNRTH